MEKNGNRLLDKFKEVKGITLIALVITIIVLLILAGVSIAALSGQNGILTKAKEAKAKTEEAQHQEQSTLDSAISEMNEATGTQYDESKKVNKPRIVTGMVPVKYTDINGTEIEKTTSEDTNWYNYGSTNVQERKWANAQTKDGSMWVWIPRYAYKINNSNHTIDVVFLKGTTDQYLAEDGSTQTAKRVTDSSLAVGTDYIVHPAFTTDIDNGGWDKELSGFWVAKYAAGYQNATEGEATKDVEYSDLKYTELDGYTSNFLENTLIKNTTKLSYPVFKANTYAYNIISVADAWLLSQEIDNANMYGLSGADSHLQKNSEWGAVAYLTQSKYGVNGNLTTPNEVEINSKNLNNTINVNNIEGETKANVYAVTSYGNSNTPNDIDASSTKNMTGVFDLDGCVWERKATFLQGGAASTPNWHNAMASSSIKASSKYLTLYAENNKKGDATNETAGWNGDYSNFVTYGSPVFNRGGNCNDGSHAGVFTSGCSDGGPGYVHGFRVCLTF